MALGSYAKWPLGSYELPTTKLFVALLSFRLMHRWAQNLLGIMPLFFGLPLQKETIFNQMIVHIVSLIIGNYTDYFI
jgi:hypothetical protein